MPALITKRQAIMRLQTETGLSRRTCLEKIAKLPTTPDGCRQKVHEAKVLDLIAVYRTPQTAKRNTGIRPVSASQRLRITR